MKRFTEVVTTVACEYSAKVSVTGCICEAMSKMDRLLITPGKCQIYCKTNPFKPTTTTLLNEIGKLFLWEILTWLSTLVCLALFSRAIAGKS